MMTTSNKKIQIIVPLSSIKMLLLLSLPLLLLMMEVPDTTKIFYVEATNTSTGSTTRNIKAGRKLQQERDRQRDDRQREREVFSECPERMANYGTDPCNVELQNRKVCKYEYVYMGGCDSNSIECLPAVECTCNFLYDGMWSCHIVSIEDVCDDGSLPVDPNNLLGQNCVPSPPPFTATNDIITATTNALRQKESILLDPTDVLDVVDFDDLATATPTAIITTKVTTTMKKEIEAKVNKEKDDDADNNDIPAVLKQDQRYGITFNTLLAALDATDLINILSASSDNDDSNVFNYTLFGPTDDAFDKLKTILPDYASIDCLLEFRNKPILTNLLSYHVVPNNQFLLNDEATNQRWMLRTMLSSSGSINNDSNAALLLNVNKNYRNRVKINNDASNVIDTDILASNGVVHAIDTVLIPPGVRVDLETNLLCSAGDLQYDPTYQYEEGEEEEMQAATECTYLGITRRIGEYLKGPTDTCFCTPGGKWDLCHPNNNN